MKKTTLAVLSIAIASVGSMAGIASAVPFGANDLPPGLSGGSPPGLNGGSPSGLNGGGGGVNPLVIANTANTPVVGVPEGGTSLLLVGVGLLGIALWRRSLQQRFY